MSAAGLLPDDWSKTGIGTTSISQSTGGALKFDYSLNSSYIHVGQWWTFSSTGGSPVSAITQDYGTSVTTPADPSREGYTFGGWSSPIPAVMPAEDAALTAKWTLNQYTVTFYNWDNTILSTQTVLYGGIATPPFMPTRNGCVLSGWRENYSNINGNITVFPVFTAEIPITGEIDNTIVPGTTLIVAAGAASIFLYRKKRQNEQ